jgi:RNA polymerase sigma-70 factor, ECF subfamily
MQPSSAIDWAHLVEQRDFLVRFARRRLRDPAQAEDLVHDVFEAVMSGRAQFGGRCALRSWLVAVLRHKIVDLVRDTCSLVSIDADEDDDNAMQAIECPQPRPDQQAEQRQRLRHALAGIAALPDALRQVVELRVLDDLSTEQVCSALAISADNLFVRLHRARRQLAAA